jgi:cell division septation protein DedD
VERRQAGAHPFGLPARYTSIEKIGEGGVGVLYRARDMETNEILALKVLKPEVASDPQVQANFNKELCLARKITHKNVCRIYDLYRNERIAFTTMEYVEGGTLYDAIRGGNKLPLAHATAILSQICAGLREAHAQGIVHRDLKPANIMINRSGVVKIMDFGIARLMDTSSGHTTTLSGTPAYMSPEQASGKLADARTDIYALGLIFYEMVTGVPTFSAETPVAVALKHVIEKPRSPRELAPELPRNVEAAILKCLAKNPEDRFATVDEFIAAIEKIETPRIPVKQRLQTAAQPLLAAAQPMLDAAKPVVAAAYALAHSEIWGQAVASVRNYPVREKIAELALLTRNPRANAEKAWKWSEQQARALDTKQKLVLAGALSAVLLTGTAAHFARKTTIPNAIQPINSTSATQSIVNAGPAAHESPDRGEIEVRTVTFGNKPAQPASGAPPSAGRSDDRSATIHASETAHSVSPSKTAGHKKASVSAKNAAAAGIVVPSGQLPAAAPVSFSDMPDARTELAPEVVEKPAAAANAADANAAGSKNFLAIGNFKFESVANGAAQKVESLGYHATVTHRTRLWMSSYHVMVGPFATAAEAQAAIANLETRGYQAKRVNSTP